MLAKLSSAKLMNRIACALNVEDFPALLRAEPALLRGWIERNRGDRWISCLVTIVLGAGLYGTVMGWWRHPLQALFTGLKFPLVILLTTLGNSLLNAMLAPLLGLNVTLRQSLMVILMTFTIATMLLGAFSPLALFVVWNTPPLAATTGLVSPEYGFLQITHVAFIAVAGVMGNICLAPLLRLWSGSASVARNVLLAWLAVNLLLGSQICWLLRPFIWDPARPVEFLGPEYFRGSFYETVFDAARRLLSS
jgi:hypothetical protein